MNLDEIKQKALRAKELGPLERDSDAPTYWQLADLLLELVSEIEKKTEALIKIKKLNQEEAFLKSSSYEICQGYISKIGSIASRALSPWDEAPKGSEERS